MQAGWRADCSGHSSDMSPIAFDGRPQGGVQVRNSRQHPWLRLEGGSKEGSAFAVSRAFQLEHDRDSAGRPA